MMEGALDRDRFLAEFITSVRFEQLSARDLAVAKAGIVDCLAVMISGSRTPAISCLMEEVQGWGGKGKAVVVGHNHGLPAVWACLLNGTAAAAEHFDDLTPGMPGHPSCTLVPALISVASMRPLSGRDWIEAYACGFEVGVKLGRMTRPALYRMGFHATTVLGVVMTTAAAARLLGLDVPSTRTALGIAASLASGVRANFGSMTMALHAGHAASQGMLAVSLAQKGFSSDPESLTGRFGLLDCYAGGQYDCQELANLGKPFELSRSGLSLKFYPSGHPTVCAIEAALHLREAHSIKVEMIEEIDCFVGPWIRETLNKTRPLEKGKEGKVNLPFCLAVALARGDVVEADFRDEVLKDPVITGLRNRCQVHVVQDLPDHDEYPARVKIKLSDGRVVTEQKDRPSGSAASLPPWDRVVQKFRNQSLNVLGSERMKELLMQFEKLEDLQDVTSITKLLQIR